MKRILLASFLSLFGLFLVISQTGLVRAEEAPLTPPLTFPTTSLTTTVTMTPTLTGTPTPTPTSTMTPTPTGITTPTPTMSPTSTPTISPTMTPTVTPTPESNQGLQGTVTYRNLGRVFNALSALLKPGTHVTIDIQSFFGVKKYSTTTDDKGHYMITLPDGLYIVSAGDKKNTFFVPPVRVVSVRDGFHDASFQGLIFPSFGL